MNLKHIFALGLLAAMPAAAQLPLPPPPTPYTPNATVVEDVVARINDQIITRSDMVRAQAGVESEMHAQGATSAQIDAREKNLLRDQIDQQLLLSKGKDLDITCETELVKQLDEIRKQNHLDTMEDLEKAVQSQGLSYEDFKASMRNNCISQHVVQQEVGSKIPLTHAEIQKYYDAHKAELAQPESIRLSEILIPVDATANAAAVAAAQAKANMVIANLKAGGKFDALAKLYSGGPTAQAGGDLGVFKRGALAAELEAKTFALEAGQYTAPIRTRQGFVILDVTQHVHAGIPPLKDVNEQIEEALYESKMQPALRAYLTTLREQAAMYIAPGFVDTGASSNEPRIYNTTYTPPAPKAKKAAMRNALYTRNSKKGKGKGKATKTSAVLSKNGKPKKIRREKVRFGQSPRENLPVAKTGGDLAADIPAQVGPNAPTTLAADATPAVSTSNEPDPNADPLAPKAVVKKKTRFTDHINDPKVVKQPSADDIASKPSAPTTQESIKDRFLDAPLGLRGDDNAKKKKPAHVKGQKKPRFSDKAKQKKSVDQTAQPITVPVEPVKN